jgi:ElaB/YqjD/DUF883 family membrane-anchored ribosome-binding protein
MNTIDVEKMKSDLKEETQQVNEVLAQVRGEMEKAKKELADLEAKLPKFLVQFYLREIPKAEISKTKKRRKELREFLEDYPFISAGLGDHLKTFSTRGTQIFLLEKQIRRYETLKTELFNRHRTDLENELMGLSQELDCLADAKAFLNSLKREVKS